MGFFDWLMKGIGFETDEDAIKQKKKKNKNKTELTGLDQKQELSEQPEVFDASSYDAFGSVDANKFSATGNLNNDEFAPENGVAGFGTKNVVIHRPKTYKEVQGLIDYLKQGESAIMILDGLSPAEAQRILDFVSGAVYALSGSTQRIDGNIFLLTPEGYNIVS